MMENMNHPIRVLLLFTSMNRGGAETMVMNYYRHIDRSKIQFDFMVHREQRGAYDDEIESMGGRIYRMPPIYPQYFYKYKKLLRSFFDEHREYIMIHSHMSELGYFAFKEAQRHNIPFRICHAHNAPDFRHENFMQYLKLIPRYYFIRRIRHLTTDFFVCSHIAGLWLYGKKRQSQFVFMKNAIELEQFSYSPEESCITRQKIGCTKEQNIICHVGRFNIQKNHDFLIDVFYKIQMKDPSAILLLIGDGEQRKHIEQKVNNLHIQHKVKFLGVRNDVNMILKASNTFLFPSLYEGLSVVLVEAQATGIRCVVTDTLAKETIICNDIVEQLSLKQSVDEWADVVLRQHLTDRQEATNIMRQAGWDVSKNAEWLQNYYLQLARNVK